MLLIKLFNGPVKQYISIAVGELILVVAGILIAFQIENWKEYLDDREKEANYISRIVADLEEQVEVFDQSYVSTSFLG